MKLAVLLLLAAAESLLPQEISHATAPRVTHTVPPEYTKEALDAKLQGVVILSAIVGIDGAASNIKVVRGLGQGLDEKAVACVGQWRFSPGL
jgi:periplasmic protein TonB